MRVRSTLAALRADASNLLGSDARLFHLACLAAAFLVPLTLAIAFLVYGTGPEPRRNWLGGILGVDFTQVWVAGRLALQGRAGEPYDLALHLANLQAAFGPECRFAWHYPPVFLLPAAAIALLPPEAAFPAWSALSLGLFALALRLAAGGRGTPVLIALAHPLVFCNLVYGQNGLFTAGLLTLGALLVDRRPWLAGVCFGLTCYKPQLAALAPLLLLATGRRACLAACIVTVVGLCLASLAAFGTAPWQGFLDTLGQTNHIILEEAAAGLDINAAAFGAVRLLGGSMAAAWAFQAAVSLAAVATAWRVWTICPDQRLRAATLLAAAPLTSPYLPLYDLAPMVTAALLLALAAGAAGGLRGYERWLLLLTPVTAGLLRSLAGATSISFGLLLGLATLACIALRAVPVPTVAAYRTA